MKKTFALLLIVVLIAGCTNPALGSAAPTPQIILPASPAPIATAKPTPAVKDAVHTVAINSRADLQSITKEIVNAAPAAAQSRANELWQALTKDQRVPLIFGDQVIFFYKGQADQVQWRGTFNGWSAPGLEGQHIGQTDLWVAVGEFPPASRVEYKIVVNNKDWVVDAVNPKTTFSGMTGVNNVITLRGFTVTDESQKRNDVIPGTLTGEISITSQYLGYPVNYWVYTPAGYENLKQLPVLYVLDGNDFVDERMGALPNILANLIAAGRIEPVIAVFVDARDPNNPTFNRREEEFLVHPIDHAKFIADELVPTIDRTYRTDPQPAARVIAGVSYGGVGASYIAVSRSDVFHNLAVFSMSYWVLNSPQYLSKPEQAAGVKLMRPAFDAMSQCGGDTGFTCPRLPLKIFLSAGFADWDVGDFTPLVSGLQGQGYPVEFHQTREGHSWDNWRGLSDEMLIDFFGAD